MIRVLHVVTYMGRGGLETMLMNYYRKIDRSKVQFDFLVHRKERWDYDDEIESMGGKIYRLPRLNPWNWEYLYQLKQFFQQHAEYKIVHSHIDCMSAIPLRAAKQAGIKVRIAHAHSNNQDRDVKYFLKLYYRQKIKKYATHYMACGQAAGEWMFRGVPFQIVNNAIDAAQYIYNKKKRNTIRERLEIQPEELVIGHVGRFSPPKNHDFLLDIFAEVVKQTPAKLLLVGDGTLRSNIEQKVKKLGLGTQVIFTGKRSDVADLLQAMDVFVFPSVYEGLGMAAIEAQAAGLPCFVSNGVPMECDLTGLVRQISLSVPAKTWAHEVVGAKNIERDSTYDTIKAQGYDIVENAEKLQSFYLEAIKGNEYICI